METYKISKYEPKEEKWYDYGGGYSAEDVKQITKGFRQDDIIEELYSRKGSNIMFEVIPEF